MSRCTAANSPQSADRLAGRRWFDVTAEPVGGSTEAAGSSKMTLTKKSNTGFQPVPTAPLAEMARAAVIRGKERVGTLTGRAIGGRLISKELDAPRYSPRPDIVHRTLLPPRTCSFDPGRTGRNSPSDAPSDAATGEGTVVTSPKRFRGSIAWLDDPLSPLRSAGLPAPDARLASGCSLSSAGRVSHPQGSIERFQLCFSFT